MSDFIRILNLIKTRRNLAWLTNSQQEALTQLRKALSVPGTINLFGLPGVGKTFLGWTLADEFGYTYFSHFSHFRRVENLDAPGVILDNCQPNRQTHREILKILNFRNIGYAVLISRQIVHDYTYYVELLLTPADQAKVRDNLASIGFYGAMTETSNLWHLVNPYL